MRRATIALLLLLAGCGAHRHSTPAVGESGPAHDGTEGAVCGWGHEHENESLPTPAACQAGLTCCYPCGIDGCDSVCEDVPGGDCPELP